MGLFGSKAATHRPEVTFKAPVDLMQTVTHSSQMILRQKRELTEIFLGFETCNRYQLFDFEGAPCGTAVERGGGVIGFIKRIFFRSHRPFVIDIFDANGQPVLELSRVFFFFFSDIIVKVPTGQLLGSAHRRFGILHKIYDLRGPEGQTFARIKSSVFKIWTFAIRDAQDQELGRISKKWSGMLKEMFTDADNFMIEFGTTPWSARQRATIVAAALAIDFDFFENNNSKN